MSIEASKFNLKKTMHKLMKRKSLTDITVTELCEISGVGRRSFYRYYFDKYDLLQDLYYDFFFSKIKINPDENFWDIVHQMIYQIYDDQDFFRHAFKVVEQNGFWEEAEKLLVPLLYKELPKQTIPEYDELARFYTAEDVNTLLKLIVKWNNNNPCPPDEFAYKLQISFAIRGKWLYELAMKYELKDYDEQNISL